MKNLKILKKLSFRLDDEIIKPTILGTIVIVSTRVSQLNINSILFSDKKKLTMNSEEKHNVKINSLVSIVSFEAIWF